MNKSDVLSSTFNVIYFAKLSWDKQITIASNTIDLWSNGLSQTTINMILRK